MAPGGQPCGADLLPRDFTSPAKAKADAEELSDLILGIMPADDSGIGVQSQCERMASGRPSFV